MSKETANLMAALEKAPTNCWIALTEDQSKIIGRGETMEEAIRQAQTHGVEDPFVMWVPSSWMPCVYFGVL